MPPKANSDIPVVILAGGQSRRMGGADKAELELEGVRLIDRVRERLARQSISILISGPRNYGLALPLIPDLPDGPAGPAGALFALIRHFEDAPESPHGFCTVPVDAPFVPDDLIERLSVDGVSSIAASPSGLHPTFGYWDVAALRKAIGGLRHSDAPSLKAVARRCSAREVFWPSDRPFFNLNTPEDVSTAQTYL